jgi:hypothetical protein
MTAAFLCHAAKASVKEKNEGCFGAEASAPILPATPSFFEDNDLRKGEALGLSQ